MDEAATYELKRRTLLRGAGLTGAAVVAAPILAACGSDEPAATDTSPEPTVADEPTDGAGDDGAGGDVGYDGEADVLTATWEVPEGGGVILEDDEVVVAQPVAGEFTAFSSICTHQGCPVSEVVDGTINCACHGSQFSIEDGSVVAGPAPSPLPAVDVAVDGGFVVRA